MLEPENAGAPPDDANAFTDPEDVDDLDFLLDASTPDLTWFIERYKSQDEINTNPRGKGLVFVAKLPAPIDLNAFHREYGGGVYRFARQLGNGHFDGSRRVELDGPPRVRVFDPPRVVSNGNGHPAPAAVYGQGPPMDPQTRYLRLLAKEIRALRAEAAQARSAPVVAAQPAGLDMIGTIFNLADRMANRATTVPDTLTPVIEAFTKGLDLGTAREPVTAATGTDWVAIAREAAPIVKEMLGGLAAAARARQGGMRPNPSIVTPPPASSGDTMANPPNTGATSPPPAPATESVDDMAAVRWRGLVDSLARAIGRGGNPVDWTDSLPDMMLEADLTQLRLAGPERIMAELKPQAGTYPILDTPAAEAFVRRVHAELVNPSESEPESE